MQRPAGLRCEGSLGIELAPGALATNARAAARNIAQPPTALRAPLARHTQPNRSAYFAITRCARRFCCQQVSLCSVQNGRSLPQLTVSMRFAAIPRETR